MEDNNAEFINLTPENVYKEHLCCIIRTKISHPGTEAKREWLSQRLSEGHVFRKLNKKLLFLLNMLLLKTPGFRLWVTILSIYTVFWLPVNTKAKDMAKSLCSIA